MTPPLSLSLDAKLLKSTEAKEWAKDAGLEGKKWKGLAWDLPFFTEAVIMAEIMDEDDMTQTRHYLFKDKDMHVARATFGSDVVETLAAHFGGLSVTRDTILDYIAFYVGFTRGAAGRVQVIQNVDDLVLREELTIMTRRGLQSLITPMTAISDTEAQGCFLITDKLFKAKAAVGKDGSLLLDPTSIIADTLPVY